VVLLLNQCSGQPPLKLRCKICSESSMQKDASEQSVRLIQQAEACSYFLSQEQAIAELLPSPDSNPLDSTPDPVLNPKSRSCCWSTILSQQSDFLSERPLLQSIIEDAGHICLFLPKFHCELNPIELFWSYIKQGKALVHYFFLLCTL